MDTSPLILSIIIPSYGRQDSLNSLLDELYRQASATGKEAEVEIIVVDDGTNPPLQLVDGTVKTHWIRLDANSGAPAARKLGFRQSSGKFIHFHDSDDSIGEGWLPYLISKLQTSTGIDFLLSARRVLKENGQEIRTQKFIKKFQHKPDKIADRLKFNNCFGPLGGLTFSRDAVIQMRFNNLKSCQDWDMYIDAITNTAKVVSDDNFYFIKNETDDTRISSHINKKVLGFLKLGRIHNTEISNCSITRLFYIHCIKRNFRNCQHQLFNRFYKRFRIKILLSYICIEILKLRAYL